MGCFQINMPVQFGHCDPAGIVFYPRYFEMINTLVENWLERGLGVGIRGLLDDRQLLVPTVAFNVEFFRPSRFGETLSFELNVTRLGRSACTVALRAICGGETRVAGSQVLVFISSQTRTSVAVPADLRTRIEAFIGPTEAISASMGHLQASP